MIGRMATTATISPMDAAVEEIGLTDSLGVPLGPGLPGGFLHALGAREAYDDLVISGALLVDLYEVFLRPGVHYLSGFFGPAERFLRDAGGDVQFVPADFRRFAPLLEELAPRVMSTVCAPPDNQGYMSLSLHAGATVGELHRAGASPRRKLIVEINERFPRTYGMPPDHRHAIHVDEADLIVQSDVSPFVLEDPPLTEIEHAIAEHAVRFVTDGCTLQTGIGAIPSAIAGLLATHDGGGYGVHSEMFTTGLMELHRAGKVTNDKGEYDKVSVTTFAAGTQALYDWLDGNEQVRFLPADLVNDPGLISHNRKMVTINGAVSVDLAGQAMADTIGGKQFSGIGGHEDFVGATGVQLEDRSLVCLPSTATGADGSVVSRIVDEFPAGAVVTTPRHQLDVVITEHGAAELRGKTVRDRRRALAAIAHPQFRDRLLEAAETADI
jgi:acyl-CoA hydrolase